MRNYVITCIFFIATFSVSAQSEKWKQKNARINFAITPQFEFVKIGGKFNPTASLSGAMVFNNTYFLGGYFTRKMIRNYNENPLDATTEIDVNYQTLGIEFLYHMRLGLYRTEGGHYVHPKLRIVFGGRFGGGAFSLDNSDKDKITTRDYFYFIQPQVGVTYPLNDYISINGGACFTTALSVDKLDVYYETKDFTGPGIYLAFKFFVFR